MARLLLPLLALSGGCQPAAAPAPEPPPSLERQCAMLGEALRPGAPLPPRGAEGVGHFSWAYCGQKRRAVTSARVVDAELRSATRSIVQSLEMCNEQLFRMRARWTLLEEAPASPAREVEEQRLLKAIDEILSDVRAANAPSLVALDRRCGTTSFGPQVEVVGPSGGVGSPAGPP